MSAARHAAWAASMHALHQEAAGVMEMWTVLLTDALPLMQEAEDGNPHAFRILQTINQAVDQMAAAPAGQGPLCGCCSVPLGRSSFAFVVVSPAVDNPERAVALAICRGCGTDRASVSAAGLRAVKDIWPAAREIGPMADAGHA